MEATVAKLAAKYFVRGGYLYNAIGGRVGKVCVADGSRLVRVF